jgi:hypothetical protein
MKLFLLTTDKSYGGFLGDYDSAVVAAISEEQAKMIHPNGYDLIASEPYETKASSPQQTTWPNDTKFVKAKYLGNTYEFDKPCVICASFNAG